MAEEGKTRSIAIAGIVATVFVGTAGAIGSWLIARDDRANQRSLAHQARVYDHRVETYLAALRLIERQRLQISDVLRGGSPQVHRRPARFVMSD